MSSSSLTFTFLHRQAPRQQEKLSLMPRKHHSETGGTIQKENWKSLLEFVKTKGITKLDYVMVDRADISALVETHVHRIFVRFHCESQRKRRTVYQATQL